MKQHHKAWLSGPSLAAISAWKMFLGGFTTENIIHHVSVLQWNTENTITYN
jgi:hypothetical protein